MTAHTPAEQAIADQQVNRIVEDLVHDYADRFPRTQVEEVYRDSYDKLVATAKVTTFLPVLAGRFAGERLDARALAEGKHAHRAPAVLFVCVHNAGRSQMSAALLRSYAGQSIHVYTAGSDPAEAIHPEVRTAMTEIGLSLEQEFPKPLTHDVLSAADVVVTLGCGDECPVVPGRRYEDWPVADPAGATASQVAAIRADLDARVRELIVSLLPGLDLPAPMSPAAQPAAR
ncbi:arsenate reductase ArsC [Modestobacter marinus]|uniref:arsenate reductase ArsC n=1 Tax=Modestobacter marinus TaxID=477641 RepID=UPI001C98D7E0|nr:arsenate reductase ArsC [Modestobacter marinus]